ncbi:DUF362 domain-containing protein [Nitratidesulfovibrio termitidis]|uniref:DUF362 domain-containing protein n=1 Tax=Nitratidesulfovibrio termitidis TaxID=42252 RepID=UPI000424E7EC|nr:DUF362 domain-containing protein [Nitratidesulfovibrio termitidis]
MSKPVSRRDFLKGGAVALGTVAVARTLRTVDPVFAAQEAKAEVFFSRDLSAEGLRKLYARVNQGIRGKVAVKVHTGEPNGPNIIPREWVRALLPDVPNPTMVECNVLYPSPRQTTEGHRETLATNGWDFCPVDIMDADGDVNLPVAGGKWISELAVGRNITRYDSMVVLTHFKGHTMGGFGGSLKNIAIGCASGKVGKEQLHREGAELWSGGPNFMERMVEGGKAIVDHFGPRITYINVLRNMSVDCDCAGVSAAPVVTPDIGILASTDILAVDQASVDMVYALPAVERQALVERIESRSGLHQLAHMKALKMGTAAYEVIPV